MAKRLQMEHDLRHVEKYVKKRGTPTTFDVGSFVVVQYHDKGLGKRPPTKLHTVWKGPMKVETVDGNRYTLRNLVTGKLEDFHLSQLKQFLVDNPDPVSLHSIAARDEQQFIVESITQHKGNTRAKHPRALYFYCTWQGGEKTWEPFQSLKNNIILHNYLRSKNLEKFIPTNFQEGEK